MSQVKGVLLDSGDTLVRPIGGAWWPGAHFRRILLENGVKHFAWKGLEGALQKGMDYLDTHPHVLTEDEECDQFKAYYKIVLGELGLSEQADNLLTKLAEACVDQTEFHPFPETRGCLERLEGRGLRLGIISNGWPSLERKYREFGIRNFFHAFVISSQAGCCKPDERIYHTAIEQMELPAEALLFVDDWSEAVQKANEMGMTGVWLDRRAERGSSNLNRVESLEELLNMLESQSVNGA